MTSIRDTAADSNLSALSRRAATETAHRPSASAWRRAPWTIAFSVVLSACASQGAHPDAAAAPSCHRIDAQGVDALFERWNNALTSGSAEAVVDLYAERSILLPTKSAINRITREGKIAYFTKFQADKPSGKIDTSMKFLDCNVAINAGDYTFTYQDPIAPTPARYTFTYGWDEASQQWLITSHHSSVVPEDH